jgi:hypothetical protein
MALMRPVAGTTKRALHFMHTRQFIPPAGFDTPVEAENWLSCGFSFSAGAFSPHHQPVLARGFLRHPSSRVRSRNSLLDHHAIGLYLQSRQGRALSRLHLSEAGLGRDTRRDLLAEVEWAI